MMDLDGDVFADQVLKTEASGGTVEARLNTQRGGNLLEKVTCPLGGSAAPRDRGPLPQH
ncbi:MAG: hypothetical protein ACYC8T_37415 [Myxococcaceae bacterium]